MAQDILLEVTEEVFKPEPPFSGKHVLSTCCQVSVLQHMY